MSNTFDDIHGLPNPLTYAGSAVLFLACALVFFAWPYLPRVPESAGIPAGSAAHQSSAPVQQRAYLQLRPRAKPWHADTTGEWAARFGQCLHLPARTIDTLRYQYARGITAQADFTHLYPYPLVSVSLAGVCHRLGSALIRDRPKLGMIDIDTTRFVELAPLRDGSHVFAYWTLSD